MTSFLKPENSKTVTLRAMTQRLLEVLQQETDILARQDHKALLELLPVKETLARRILETLEPLTQEFHGSPMSLEEQDDWLHLQESLRRIEAINEANGRYIADLLTIHQELLSLLLPHTYGHGAQKTLPAIKGCGVSTEA
ncbi:MAG: hypothetical protein WHS46_01995 [Desulfosoma sp.]